MSLKIPLLDKTQSPSMFRLEVPGAHHDSENDYLHTGLEEKHEVSATQTQRSAHCHRDAPSWHEDKEKRQAKTKLIITSVVCLVFMVAEVIGGYAAHSLAIMTDAAHLLTDFSSILVSLFSLCISSRAPSKRMTFGWHRSEIVGALMSALSIWAVTAVLVFIAIQRILNNDYEIHSGIMIITSGCAVGVNIMMAMILHQPSSSHGHSHRLSHSHSHGCSEAVSSHGNASVRAAFIHVVGDLLQSLGVFLAALIINCWPEYKIADPICTFLFSVFVLATTITILRDIFTVLMEGSPQEYDFNSVKEDLLSVGGVQAVHDLHMWALTLNHTLLSAHLVVVDTADPKQVLREASDLLESKYSFRRFTLQIEPYVNAMSLCSDCQEPLN